MALKQFLQRLWHGDEPEQRGYPITGDLNGFYSYYNQVLNQAISQSPNIVSDLNYLQAIRISIVYTCILVRAESLSSLPASVLQANAQGSQPAYTHPVYYLIHNRPNPFQSACDFWKSVSAHIDLFGNSFAIISYSGRFQPKEIKLVPDPCAVQVKETSSGECYYEFNGKEYKDYEMLHFKDMSLDGYYGLSKIKINADTLGYSSKLRLFGRNAIGTKPPGYFTTEQPFDLLKKQEEGLQKGWRENIDAGNTPFLPLGLKYMNLQINPGEAQYLEAITATKEDICGIFRVPPTLVQDYSRATFANAEQQDLVFIKYTMLPLITNIEQECNSKLFSEANKTAQNPYYVKFNVNAFMRGDFKTRTEGYKTLWERGLITGDMVAAWEDWNNYDGGDRRFIPMNMIPLDKVDEFIDKLSEPVKTNVGDQGGADNSKRHDETTEDLLKLKKNGKLSGHAN